MKKTNNPIDMNLLIKTSLLLLTCAVHADQVNKDATRAQGGTGFKINDIRTFEPKEDTIYKEDGELIDQSRAQGGTGFKIRYRASETDPNVTQGQLDEIDLINVYKGPVVSLDPFKVFDVEQQVSGQTFITDDLEMTDISLGDTVMLSGFVNTESSAILTRIEKVDLLTEWKITGYVDALTASQFSIGQQVINYSAGMINGCGGALTAGSLVEVVANEQINFSLGDVLTTTTAVQCVDETVMPNDAADVVIIEGFIDGLLTDGDFVLAGQTVDVSPSTQYIRGRAQDVQTFIKVEVEGLADINTGDVSADKVRFLEPRINLTVPIQPSDFDGNQFSVAGVTLTLTPQVQDPDMVLVGGINQAIQIQFRGYDYGAGELFVTRLNERGNVDYDAVDLTGFVNDIAQPLITVFGVEIDTTTSDLIGLDGLPATATDFFNALETGAEVELEEATLDQLTGQLSGGTLTLLELPDKDQNQPGTLDDNAIGVGTLTSLPEIIFANSFEQ